MPYNTGKYHHQTMQRLWRSIGLSLLLGSGLSLHPISPSSAAPVQAHGNRVFRLAPAQDNLQNHLQAIVHLQDLAVPPPQTTGSDRFPLVPLGRTGVHVLRGTFANQPQWFLVDTGASTSLLSDAITQDLSSSGEVISQDQLGFAVAGEHCLDMSATLHQVPQLHLQAVSITNLWGLQFQHVQIPQGVSAVLGMDVLRQFDLHIHTGQQTLRLLPPTALPPNVKAQAVPLHERMGVMLATVQLNGQGPLTMLLDTGAGSTFISEAVAQQLQLQPETMESIQIQGFCGLETAARSQLSSIQLQDHQQTDLDVIVLSSPILEMLDVDGILGQNFLQHYRQYWRFTPTQLPSGAADGSLLLYPESGSAQN